MADLNTPRNSTLVATNTKLDTIATKLESISNKMGANGTNANGDVVNYDDTEIRALIAGKSTVVANPQGNASADLTKISIDGTVYSIPEGQSGSGGGNTTIVTGGLVAASESIFKSETAAIADTITLSKSADSFNELIFIVKEVSDSNYTYEQRFSKTTIESALADSNIVIAPFFAGNTYYLYYNFTADDTLEKIRGTNGMYIDEIIGITYAEGGGGGSSPSSEVISIAAGDGGNSRTFTFTKKPKIVHLWFTVSDKWSMSEDIFWGQPWGVYNCTNGNAPYSSGAQGSNTIVFDDNNLTMTITGVNALGCANNSNGYGYMWVEYGGSSSSGGGSDSSNVFISLSDYDALPSSKESDNKVYFIHTDIDDYTFHEDNTGTIVVKVFHEGEEDEETEVFFCGWSQSTTEIPIPAEIAQYLPADTSSHVYHSSNWPNGGPIQNGWVGFYAGKIRLWDQTRTALTTGTAYGVVKTSNPNIAEPQMNRYVDPRDASANAKIVMNGITFCSYN